MSTYKILNEMEFVINTRSRLSSILYRCWFPIETKICSFAKSYEFHSGAIPSLGWKNIQHREYLALKWVDEDVVHLFQGPYNALWDRSKGTIEYARCRFPNANNIRDMNHWKTIIQQCIKPQHNGAIFDIEYLEKLTTDGLK